ncbi:MAG: glycerol-3-phosphate dehydrogenase/oxidase [Actinomycetota bacterium]
MAASWTRSDHLRLLHEGERFDVVAIGGGVIGAGAALDLAARGLSVALVEQHDFASGTSGRSTKLFHGGIRYLPQFRFQLVAEGLREQQVLARIADYLFEPLEFVVPVFDQHGLADAPAWAARGRRASIALGAGLTLYDFLGGLRRPGERHRKLPIAEVMNAVPLLRTDGLRGGFAYSDAQTDDARLVIALARTAVNRFGAVAVNRMKVTEVRSLRDGYRVGMEDGVSGEWFPTEAKSVIVATGAFPPPTLDEINDTDIVLSKGAHLIVDPQSIGLGHRAVVLPKTDDGRVLFLIPWLGHALIGTTDTAFAGDPAHPVADDHDVAYLTAHVRRFLNVADLSPLSGFAGLRALAGDGSLTTSQASREHVISESRPGYVRVAGGKLTTYRRIAARVADHIARRLRTPIRSLSSHTLLVGAGGGRARPGMDPLRRRYGTEAAAISELASGRPELRQILADGVTSLAEVVHSVHHECAITISDFTLRRTRLAWLTKSHARSDQEAVAAVMASELGWSHAETARQLTAHEAELSAEGL